MSQTENHWQEIAEIETEITRLMIALGLDWHNEFDMLQLATECKIYGPTHAQAAYASHDRHSITKAELFGLISIMIRTMESAAREGRDVHGGEVWKAIGKHFYT
jgi:hypothetical protein